MRIELVFLAILLLGSCESNNSNPDKSEITAKLWNEDNRRFLISGLSRSRDELASEMQNLTESQWHFKEDNDRWSISEIVEHLEVQDELYHREIFLVTKTPQSNKYIEIVKGKDEEFLEYAVDTVRGNAGWALEPIGRYCSKEAASNSFLRTRNQIIKFVKETDLDLRRFFTFRKYIDDGGLSDVRLWDVRDLHQLLLTTIAHTDRHLNQLRRVKEHPNYPKESIMEQSAKRQ